MHNYRPRGLLLDTGVSLANLAELLFMKILQNDVDKTLNTIRN